MLGAWCLELGGKRNEHEKNTIVGIAVIAMGVSADAVTQKFTEDELAYMPATTQLELFKAGVITPSDVLEAQLARVEKYNGECNAKRRDLKDELDTFNAGKVNALTFACFDEARREAKAATERYRNGTARRLEGVTVGMKDDFEVRGWTHDSASFVVDAIGRNAKAEADDDVVAKLRAAGAIFPFQTTVPEFCISCMTWSRLYGVTRLRGAFEDAAAELPRRTVPGLPKCEVTRCPACASRH